MIMQIKHKLTLQFVIIVASIFFLSLLAIYYFSDKYRRIQFEGRLVERANTTAVLLVDVTGVDSTLLKIIDRNNPSALINENIAIFNQGNKLLYCNNDSLEFLLNDELFNKVRTNKEIFFSQGGFEITGIEYRGKENTYIVFAGAIDRFGGKKMHNLRTILFIVFFTGIFVVTVSGRLYAGKALSPISEMINSTDQISISNINLRLDEGNQQDELASLAKTINNLLGRLERSIMIQKKFITNASHELRTPLSAIMGQLEVTMMNERNNEYYKNKIALVLEDIKNLIQTSNQLLSLAHVSSDESEIKLAPQRIDDIIIASGSELIKRNPDYNLELHFNDLPLEESRLLVLAHEAMLKSAFQNLMENSCKFSDDKKVIVNVSFHNNFVEIKFTDNGIGIDPNDIEGIFQPFFRGKNVSQVKGNGIGLTIVEKCISLHKGSINFKSEIGRGTEFKIILPIMS